MIEKLCTSDFCDIVNKINEIIDFLNDTYLMKVKDGQYITTNDDCDYTHIIGSCTDSHFVTGLTLVDDIVHDSIDSINSVTTVASDVKCPHCGVSYYTIKSSESTCMYFAPVMKDGVNINPDRNIHTTHCECLNCHKEFDI